MNKYERVKAALKQEAVDHVPSCFSLHFDPKVTENDEVLKLHLDFFAATNSDISKIMNENLVPKVPKLETPEDWEQIEAFDRKTPFMAKQLDLVKGLREALGPDEYLMATIHGICASAIHPSEYLFGYEGVREQFAKHVRENPAPVVEALERITAGMVDYIEACLELGVDGIYYAGLGAESRFFTDEEFARYIRPYDIQMLETIHKHGGDVFLHICKDGLAMERYEGYASYADVVNWGVYENHFSLSEGKTFFEDKPVMGGLSNHRGIVVEGDDEAIITELKKVLAEVGSRGFILGADCTLPADTDPSRIRRINDLLVTL